MKPTAAPNRYPYLDHRNMAQVMADEQHQRQADRDRYERERRSVRLAMEELR